MRTIHFFCVHFPECEAPLRSGQNTHAKTGDVRAAERSSSHRRRNSSVTDEHNSSVDWEEEGEEAPAAETTDSNAGFLFRKPDKPVRTRYSTDSGEFAAFSANSGGSDGGDGKGSSQQQELRGRKRSIALVDGSPLQEKAVAYQRTGLTMEFGGIGLGSHNTSTKEAVCQELAWDSGEEADVSMAGLDSSSGNEDSSADEKLVDGDRLAVKKMALGDPVQRRVSFCVDADVSLGSFDRSAGRDGIAGMSQGNGDDGEWDVVGDLRCPSRELPRHSSGMSGSLENFRRRMSLDARAFLLSPSDQSTNRSVLSSSLEYMQRKSFSGIHNGSRLDQSQVSAMSCDMTPANQHSLCRDRNVQLPDTQSVSVQFFLKFIILSQLHCVYFVSIKLSSGNIE